jgi:acetate kinase
MKVLVLNAGSSSQKSALYDFGDTLPTQPVEPIWEAKADWTKKEGAVILKVETKQGETLEEELSTTERQQVTLQTLNTLWRGQTAVIENLDEIDVVGHRVVHGGEKYRQATRITPEVQTAIQDLIPLAPEHNPVNLEGIESIAQILPDVPQVAVFDTGFHASLPDAAKVYPLPYKYYEQGIRRYGFHGISHGYCLQRTAQLLDKNPQALKIITCHLGGGCSLAAIRDGICVDTTMGYTPLEGLMMGTRSGSVDPGILIHLLSQGETAEGLNHLLNEESGIKGLSGGKSDMRSIREGIDQGDSRAQLTFDVFIHRLRFHIGGMLASLGRLDALVFTAGIGENQSHTREAACVGWECLGIELDLDKNRDSPVDMDIATPESQVRVLVLKTREEFAIAQACWQLLHESA